MNDQRTANGLLLRRRTSPQSAALFGALGRVLTGRDDGPQLSRALGAAMAEARPGPAGGDVRALETALNEALDASDLGIASLAPTDDALVIEVSEYPALNGTPAQAEIIVFGLLEGFLTRYLNQVSGSEELSAKLVRVPSSTEQALAFAYRKHA